MFLKQKNSKHMGQHPVGPVHSESIYTVNGPIVIYIIGVIYNYIVFNLMGNDERKRGEFFYKKKKNLFCSNIWREEKGN